MNFYKHTQFCKHHYYCVIECFVPKSSFMPLCSSPHFWASAGLLPFLEFFVSGIIFLRMVSFT